MILRRFYNDPLAQASWLLGCAATGDALVIDPNRDVDQYLEVAAREGLRISHVTETHIHADFVSGARELAERIGARLLLSDEGDDQWKYGFADDAGATLLRNGDLFRVGNVEVRVVHTPGHTPEHLVFVVTDTASADQPMGVFTGDFIFVGDVGRPDLLERAAQVAGTMEEGARTLFRSLQRFRSELPEWVQIWPGHGAGSACGKALGAVPQTTLGYETRFSWGLVEENEDAFVRAVLAGQPEPPMYFAEMKRINKQGPRVLNGFARPPRLSADQLDDLLQAGVVVDTRPAGEYTKGHIPGTLHIPLGKSFATWAGSVVPFDRPIILLVDASTEGGVQEAARDLAMIGLDRVEGYFSTEALDAWMETHGELATVRQIAPEELQEQLGGDAVEIVDVRNPSEWNAGHIPGSRNVPLGRLPEQLEALPRDKPLVVHCQAGGRAAVAIGALLANGFEQVGHLEGDFGGWSRAGRPVADGGQ